MASDDRRSWRLKNAKKSGPLGMKAGSRPAGDRVRVWTSVFAKGGVPVTARVWIIAAAFIGLAISPSAAATAPGATTTGTVATPAAKPQPAASAQPQSAAQKQEAALLAQALTALKEEKWQVAVTVTTKLIALNPRWEFYEILGNAQLALQHDGDAVVAYDKALAGAAGDKATPAETIKIARAKILMNKGKALLNLKRNDEGLAAWMTMAPLSPKPAAAYFQVCFAAYDMGKMKVVVSACEQAIKANPRNADAYFLKGAALYKSGTANPEGKQVVPAGTIEALKK
jgi:tetratricopeptide (TPR) repeat protein